MRIVFVSWEYPPQFGGGIGTYVDAASGGLASRGHDVTVVTVSREPYPAREIRNGVTVLRAPFSSPAGDDVVSTLRTWQSRADAVAEVLGKLTAPGDVDVIEFCDYRAEGITWLTQTPRQCRPLSVVRLHTPLSVLYAYNTGHARSLVLEALEHQAILAADAVLSPSAALERELRSRLPELGEVTLSPHPVDAMFLAATPAQPADETDEILYVGRLEERKGVETLVAAAQRFLPKLPGARLVLVGGDTLKSAAQPSMRAVLAAMLPRELRGRVEFVDRVPRETLVERYRRARLCVFPSHFENFPNTCLEAMALGKCVIGGANSGMAEMIEDGRSGVIVPSRDADALAAAIEHHYAAPADARARLGAAARARVLAHYAPDVIARDLETCYANARKAGSPRVPGGPGVPPGSSTLQPRVAIIIPCFNHGRFLPETLASVEALRWPSLECVVVDDGSTDPQTLDTLADLARRGTRVIRQENAGLAAARNTGVRATDAPFYIPLDADDRLDPAFIAQLLPPLLADPALGYSYSHVRFFDAAAGGWECPPYEPRRLLVENLSVATAVIRRRAFDEVGGYQPDMLYGFEDWDFWLALLSIGYHGVCTPAPLFHYRKHAGGSMLTETQKRRAEMVRKMIEHHRTLFATTLEVSLAQKDQMFFAAHMDAWRLREHVAAAGGAAASTVDDELYQALLARAELDHIENSRAWRTMQRVKANPLFTALARLRYGPGAGQPSADETVAQRLARIKTSRTYRTIQWLKKNPLYRWYARRRYGSQPDRPQTT